MRRRLLEDGFTLLEVVISAALLAIVVLSLAGLFGSGFAASIKAGQITQAAALAQETMEELRACSYAELLALGAELNDGFFPCPGEVCSKPEQVSGFEGFTRYYTLACHTIEFDGYLVDGLRLEVTILQQADREVVSYISFVRRD